MPGGAKVHQALPALDAEISSDSYDRYEEADTSRPSTTTGPSAPMAAASQPASRNSRSVASKSAMRARTFSGLVTSTTEPAGMSSGSTEYCLSVSTGMSASMPSAGCFSEMRASSDDSVGFEGNFRARSSALAATVSSISNCLAGCSSTVRTSSMVRWSATAKERMSVTSSPQNSMRTGFCAVVGKTSMMPPRVANSPRDATMSTWLYAKCTSCAVSSSKSCSSSTATLIGSAGGSTGWHTARAAATMTRGMSHSTFERRPTMSGAGERRSCGSVSYAGNWATFSSPKMAFSSAARSSASWPVAVTSSTGVSRAIAPAAQERTWSMPVTCSESSPTCVTNPFNFGSVSAAVSKPPNTGGVVSVMCLTHPSLRFRRLSRRSRSRSLRRFRTRAAAPPSPATRSSTG